MGKLRQLSPELWPLIDVILFSYIELIFRGGVSCLPAALLFYLIRGNLFGRGTVVRQLFSYWLNASNESFSG